MTADRSQRLSLRSRRVVTPSGVRDAVVVIREGMIECVCDTAEVSPKSNVEDLGNLVLMPGLVDTHVHINEPGRTDWEGFETATRAAASGGVTTLVDMPLNSDPVTTSVEALTQKRVAAKAHSWVDVGFYGGVVPGNDADLEPLHDAGVLGFKAFLCDSGLGDFPPVGEFDLRKVMPRLARFNTPLLVHAELLPEGHAPDTSHRFIDYLRSRPDQCEEQAIALLIQLTRESGCPVHIVHLSTANALPAIADARAEGLALSSETCPHYLWFDAETIADGDTLLKCAPPIRTGANRQKLWNGLQAGVIDFVVSDHSPCLPRLKQPESGEFADAWGGINSIGLTLPVVWTAARGRGIPFETVARWLGQGPAELVGLSRRKGSVAAGFDADLVAWDPDERFIVSENSLFQRHKNTPYAGSRLYGAVRRTFLRGRELFREGELSDEPHGSILTGRAP